MRTLTGLLILACVNVQAAEMTELRYMDQEPGSQPYLTRILVTEKFMRVDNGRDDGDFVLFDRQTGGVSNVLHEEKILMRMIKKPLPPSRPGTYTIEEKLIPVRQGTLRVQVVANDKICSETVSVKSLFPDAARALAEYKSALAYTQLQTYRNTPDEIRQTCDLVHHVWETDRALAHGLPIEERDYAGRIRNYSGGALKNYDARLFRIPDGYDTLHLPETN